MHDVFISYKSEEYEEALWVRETLEINGISCWMAPASIPGGSNYAEQIPVAIHACKVFVLILSSRSQASRWVKRELDQAISEGKTVLPFVLEQFEMSNDINFYLRTVQRYDAASGRMEAMEKMLREVKVILEIKEELENLDAKEEEQSCAWDADPLAVARASFLETIRTVADPEELFELAEIYEQGKGLPRSIPKAMECYQEAAAQGHLKAPYQLALCYLSGERKSKGVFWLEKAAAQEHLEAQFRLGTCYLDGIGVNENEEAGIEWLSRAGERGHLRAAFRLAQLYENRICGPWSFMRRQQQDENWQNACRWYQEAAREEDPEAYYRLGRLARKSDRDQAMNYYRQAAEQRHPLAQHAMAQLYFLKKAPEKALGWLQKAAQLGSPEAQYELALYYRDGTNPPTEFVADQEDFQPRPDKADYWMEQAAEGGHGEAQFITACRFVQDPATAEKAIQLLRYAAGKGHPEAMHALAVCHWLGNGVEFDISKTQQLLEKNREYPASLEFLAQLHQDDRSKALVLLEEAAQSFYVPAMHKLAEQLVREENWVEAIYWYGMVQQSLIMTGGSAHYAEHGDAVAMFATLKKKHWHRWLFAGSLRQEVNEGWYRHFTFRDPRLDLWSTPIPRKD